MASAAAERPGRPWRGWRGWSAFGLALAALLASAGAGRGDAPAPGERRELLVVATGGLRGWLSSRLVDPRGPAHGLAHLAPAIAGLRRSDPGLVLLDAGDALGGDPTTERPGAPAIPPILGALNRLGYDALAPGVAELAAGLETAERLRAASAFPWLAANVLRADGTPWLPAWRLLERDGLRIAVVGLSSPGVALHVEPGGLGGLRFLALPPATRAWLPRLRADARADVVIGLFHSGVDGREQREAALRRHLPLPDAAGLVADDVAGFDLIVAGRGAGPRPGRSTDTPPDHGAPLIEPGDRGNGLAVARLALSRAGGRWRVTRVTRWTLPAERAADGAMLAQAEGPLAATSAWLAEPTAVRIARAPDRRTLALCLGELAHRAALRRPFPGLSPATAEVYSLLPRGWRRFALRAGERGQLLRRAQLYRWLPRDDAPVPYRVTGRQLALLLEGYARDAQSRRATREVVLHPGGLVAEIAPRASEVTALRSAAGAPLDRHRAYPVWLPASLAAGAAAAFDRALIHPSQRAGAAAGSLREALFALLSDPALMLPPPCPTFLAGGG